MDVIDAFLVSFGGVFFIALLCIAFLEVVIL